MSGNYRSRILSILVDWYEDSPAYIRNEKPNKRRLMRLYDNGKSDFNVYNIEVPAIRNDINQAVMDLADKKFIEFEWMRGEKNHILSRLWLNYDSIGQIYAYLGRRPKGDAVNEVLSQLRVLLDRSKEEWVRHWLEETYVVISRKRTIGNNLPEGKSDRNDLLKAVSELSKRTEMEILERIFSIQCFGDSKRFEHTVKPRLIRILKKYLIQDECTDDDALRYVGIVRYPEQFEFSGALSIMLPKGLVDFMPLPFGSTLTIDDVKEGHIKLGADIRRILSIENRANYVEYIRKFQSKDELVLFHGGQFSPAKGVFLKALVSAMPESCMFYHWGDIDYGGFSMLARLRREIMQEVQAWKMGIEDIKQYTKYAIQFSESYRKRLTSLLDVSELQDCQSCIKFMLKDGVRLEQEAMLMNSEQ
ncbi:MAG: DUF2220 domain-containing protein [Treponema sp.]|nr:DUF2220 domain-containing protein [Treponema sp.]